jgi:hypothetical protein
MRLRLLGWAALASAGLAVGWGGPEAALFAGGVRPLSAGEAAARQVGAPCNWICANSTLPCATAGSPSNPCTDAWRTDRATCLVANRLFDGCFVCSKAVNFKICDQNQGSDCNPHDPGNTTCGTAKQRDCQWTGAACVCPALPPNFDPNHSCADQDCK